MARPTVGRPGDRWTTIRIILSNLEVLEYERRPGEGLATVLGRVLRERRQQQVRSEPGMPGTPAQGAPL